MNNQRHLIYTHIFGLLFIAGSGLWFFVFFAGFPQRQFLVSIVMSVFYFIWGVLYHKLKGDLHLKIVLEYLLISVLAVFLLRGAIFF